MKRRDLLAGAAVLLVALAPAAWAQDAQPAAEPGWEPTEPIELVVHSGPGGGNDVLAREMIAIIEKNDLCPVRISVSNRPGGGSTTAMAYMMEMAGDPHVIAHSNNLWITDWLTQSEAPNGLLDMTQIALMVEDPAILVVRADSEYQTLEDFIAAAKANPGTLNQSGGSVMTRDNIARNVLMKVTGADWNFVSFPSGGERMAALLGGNADLYITEPAEAGEQTRSGNLRAVAQIAPERLASFPDVPTLQEIYDLPEFPTTIRGIAGPPDMPAEAVAYYEDLVRRVMETEEWKEYSAQSQYVDRYMDAEESEVFLTDLQGDIREVLTAAGLEVVR